MNDMRIGGLASGMDIDKMVEKLMKAERMPLKRMQQDKTEMTWKRDEFRDMNKSLLDLDQQMLDMKLSGTYQSKTVNSSNESAVTATASSDASEGSYNITVDQLATSATSVSGKVTNPDQELDAKAWENTYKLKVGNEEHELKIKKNDTLKDVLKDISKQDNDVRAFYDDQQSKIIMESTETGKKEAGSGDSAFKIVKLDNNGNQTEEKDFLKKIKDFGVNMNSVHATKPNLGSDAKFQYNGIEFTSKSNNYELNGINFEFKKEDSSANLTVENNTDKTFDSIINFIDTYNETIETLNDSQQEKKHRDYPPLTDKQKEEMSDKEIELWEEKAKSGLLRGESIITGGMFNLRNSWYDEVDNEGTQYSSITEIGITTSPNYMDGGKIEVDEEKLKTAIRDNPEDVQNLFSNNVEAEGRGIINRVEDAVKGTMNKIEERAGKGTSTLETYTIGRDMKDLNSRISDFQDKMERVETRYWNDFTQMEKAIQRMNAQSEQMMSQLQGM